MDGTPPQGKGNLGKKKIDHGHHPGTHCLGGLHKSVLQSGQVRTMTAGRPLGRTIRKGLLVAHPDMGIAFPKRKLPGKSKKALCNVGEDVSCRLKVILNY
jgi:hypothetical protein